MRAHQTLSIVAIAVLCVAAVASASVMTQGGTQRGGTDSIGVAERGDGASVSETLPGQDGTNGEEPSPLGESDASDDASDATLADGEDAGASDGSLVTAQDIPSPSGFPLPDAADDAKEAIASYIGEIYSAPIKEVTLIGSGYSEPQQRGESVVMWATYLVRFMDGRNVGLICSMQDGVPTSVTESDVLTVSDREVYDVKDGTYQPVWPYPEYDEDDYEGYSEMLDDGVIPAFD